MPLIPGDEFDNVLHGNDSQDDTVQGLGGNDTLDGGIGGNDRLEGGDNNDTLIILDGNDEAHGGAGDDTLQFNWQDATTSVYVSYGPFGYSEGWTLTYVGATGNSVFATGIDNFTITSGSGNDTLFAAGRSIVDAGAGNDFVDGYTGSAGDDFDGGDGIDGISADLSAATSAINWNVRTNTYSGPVAEIGSYTNFEYFRNLTTGSGNDTIVTSDVDDTNEYIWSGLGNDTVTVVNGNDEVRGGVGNDRLVIDWTDGSAGMFISYGFYGDGNGGVYGTFVIGGDRSVYFEAIENFTIHGTAYGDSIRGFGDDVIRGNEGDDDVFEIFGSAGDDVDGGGGNDRISANLSAATTAISWNVLTNSFSGPAAEIGTFANFEMFGTLTTGSGGDTIVTSQFNDTSETINSGDGADTVTVHDGGDTANMGLGNDRLVIDWRDATTGMYVSYGYFGSSLGGVYGTYIIDGDRHVSFDSVENLTVHGGSGQDRIGGIGDDVIRGNAGDDTVYGIIGSAGDDVDGGADIDGFSGDLSAATSAIGWNVLTNSFSGPAAQIGTFTNFEYFGTLTTGSGGDAIVTSQFNDTNEVIVTNDGADTVTVHDGGDTANMGLGNDRLVIDWRDATTGMYVSYGYYGSGLGGVYGTYIIDGDRYVSFDSVENFTVFGGSGNDNIRGNGDDVIRGNNGDDDIHGIIGSAGDDIDGGAGRDRISADLSAATTAITWNVLTNSFSGPVAQIGTFTNFEQFGTLITGSGNDTIVTSQYNDTDEVVTGNDGADTATVYDGNDQFHGGLGTDTLVINWSSATTGMGVTYGYYNDGLGGVYGTYGIGGDRSVYFTSIERFNITGGSGDDVIHGWDDNDIISAGGGNDSVAVYLGLATASGGSGYDGISAYLTGATTAITYDISGAGFSGPAGYSFTAFEYFGTFRTGSGDDAIRTNRGSFANETIETYGGNDTITVFDGADVARGGTGFDRLVIDWSTATTDAYVSYGFYGDGDGGIFGSYHASATYDVGFSSIEVFTITSGSGNDTLYGWVYGDALTLGAGNDTAFGGYGDDVLDGRAGNDTLNGELGRDTVTYASDAAAVTVNLATGTATDGTGGTDTLTGIENVIGSAGNDTITGSFVGNTIDGGAGNDTMTGGNGADTYYVRDAGDVVVEAAGGGYDTIIATRNVVLGAAVENLTFTGNGNYSGQGSNSANVITGSTGNDTLTGGAGQDLLIGAGGDDNLNGGNDVDIMIGGTLGAELLVNGGFETIDGTDDARTTIKVSGPGDYFGNHYLTVSTLRGWTIASSAGRGEVVTDNRGTAFNTGDGNVVFDMVSFPGENVTLRQDVEGIAAGAQLVLSFTAALPPDSTSTDLALEVRWNGVVIGTVTPATTEMTRYTFVVAASAAGTGAGGANRLELADITATSTNGTGVWIDAVSLRAIEEGTGRDTLVGGNAADMIYGGADNDTLDGGAGSDLMYGGTGNDIYIVDAAGDRTYEEAGGGTDEVRTALAAHTLMAGVENLTYTGTGTAAFAGTGNAQNNVIRGGAGADTLDGLAGNDTLEGGAGNDTYRVDAAGDIVTELAGEGTDLVLATAAAYTLGEQVENLTFAGTGGFAGTGNALANRIVGGAANDTLDGAGGADTLEGGAGDDTYRVDEAGDATVELAGGGNDTVLATAASYTLGAEVETLSYVGTGNFVGTGNAQANRLTGGGGNDTLDGAGGADTLEGGLGDDTYVVDAADTIVEAAGAGRDTVRTALATYTLGANLEALVFAGTGAFTGIGNALVNAITGGAGADVLDGGVGDDTLTGGAGDDTYRVDSSGDTTVELAGGGTDTVEAALASYTLGAEVERLVFTGTGTFAGTGNAGDNQIRGGTGGDTLKGLAGNDTLFGDAGNDTLDGGDGIDTADYSAFAAALTIRLGTVSAQATGAAGSDRLVGIENVIGGGGADTLVGTAGDNRLQGNAGNDSLSGAGGLDWLYGDAGNDTLNAGNGNDQLFGGIGNDILNGQLDADTMTGGAGDDQYYVDAAGDSVVELANEGLDTVRASITYTLGDHVERLFLLGLARSGTGNGLDNAIQGSTGSDTLNGLGGADTIRGNNGIDTIDGGDGNDTLFGGALRDTLTGGLGADGFRFEAGDTSSVIAQADRITDFTRAQGDRIYLNLIDANANAAGDQAFAFIGAGAYTGVAGQLRAYALGTDTMIAGDTNGDSIADLYIRLTGSHTMLATDFAL